MCICILALRGNLTACDRPSIQCAVSCWARGLLPGLLCHSGLQSYGSLAPRRGHRGFEHESLNTSACGLRSPTHVNITQLSELHWYTWMCHVPGRSRESLPGPRTGLRWGPESGSEWWRSVSWPWKGPGSKRRPQHRPPSPQELRQLLVKATHPVLHRLGEALTATCHCSVRCWQGSRSDNPAWEASPSSKAG